MSEDFDDNYIWSRDDKNEWYIIKKDRDGKYRGDCEDYALTSYYNLVDGSWLKFWGNLITGKAKMVRCESLVNGEGHVVLRYDHEYNDYGNWVRKTEFSKSYKISSFRYLWPTVGLKMLMGKVKGY